ncbi:MAG: MATE family efflux transporter [Clostridia bacterium]|nr:MATE family efflux transporter [Clostridia bacterium]
MFKKLFSATDMTVGTPWKAILGFSIPMLIGNIAQQLYSTVDSIVVGRYVGDNALAAVGITIPIINMLLVLLVGISTGAGVMVSQYFGAKRRDDLSNTIGTCITLTALSSLFLMLVAPPLLRPLLNLLNTPATIIDDCYSYLFISMMGIAGMSYYNILSGILRGLGDSVSALLYLVIATVINIALDLVFVIYFNMGVPGVALATIIAQAISSVCCWFKLAKMTEYFDIGLARLKPAKKYLSEIVRLGLPAGATQAVFSVAMIVVQSLTNTFGEMVIAANVIVMRVDGFAMMPNFSFGTAMTTYAGQNVGARKYDRVSAGAKQGTLLCVACSTVITGIILLFGKSLMGIFTTTTELVDLSYRFMSILAVGYIAVGVTQTLSGIMRGAGDATTPMWISLISTIVFRLPLAYLLAFLTRSPELPGGNFIVLPISLLTAWLMGALITTLFYRKGAWKKKALQ